MNTNRIEPTSPRNYPSAPPMSTVAPPPQYNPYPQPHPAFSPSPTQQAQQPGMLNVPPSMYSVPGPTTTQQPMSQMPVQALKPMAQPPPAPSLNEVILTEDKQRVRCPYCYASIVTQIKYQTGMMTHIAAFAVFVVCCPCAWIPYTIDICKDVDHTCPNCQRAIGKFKRFT